MSSLKRFMMSRTIQMCSHAAAAVNNPETASAADTCHAAALSVLTSNRHSPDSVSQFRSFSNRGPLTPTPRHAPRVTTEVFGDGPGDDGPDDNGPGDGGPGDDDPNGDDPNGDYPDLGDEDNDLVDLPEQDDPGMIIFNNLSHAINRLVHVSCPSESSRTKVCEPDTFDSTNSKKLCTFLVQCELNFQDRLKAFQTDRAKVTYVQSYLKGMALEWFKLDLLGFTDPDARPYWMSDWQEFVIELQTTFGPHDPIADTKHQLNHLRMNDTHCINRYVVDFNRIVSQIRGYGDGALRHHFYTGLPDRIKDEISHVGKPKTLNGLRALTQEIDARYWEHKEEVACQTKSAPSTTTTTSKSTLDKTEKGKTSSGNTTQIVSSSSNPTHKKSGKTAELSEKLGKDGKLTADERKHRFNQGLCMFCGGSGHKAKECPKSGSRAAKARAATTITAMLEAKPMASTEEKK